MRHELLIVNHPKFSTPLRRGLEELGLTTVHETWTPDCESVKRSFACIVSFYDCLRHPLKVWRLKRRLTLHGVPLVAWNQDAPHYLNRAGWRLDWLDRARLLDVYATHTLIDTKRSFADCVLYLPNAADVSRYRVDDPSTLIRLRDPSAYRIDVSFFGGMNGMRYKEDRARAEFFPELARRLDKLGISHDFREASELGLDDQIAFIQASRINLNFGARCEFGAEIASGLPERCFGIPACGGFLLCDKRTHARDDFAVGDNWAEFDKLEDCIEKIRYWLDNFGAARNLAERCYDHVMSHHTYTHRARQLNAALEAWHHGKGALPR